MRSLGNKNDLRNIHVIETMCFVFLQNALRSAIVMSCDDDCLTQAHPNYVYSKLTDDRLLMAGVLFKN